MHCICCYYLGLVYKKVNSNQWNMSDWILLGLNWWNVPLEYIVIRHLNFHGLHHLNVPWFLALLYLVDRQSVDGIITKLFSVSSYDEEVWKCLVLIGSLWVNESQAILKGLSNKRSGTLTVMFKHNVHDKEEMYLWRMTQKYSGLLLPCKHATADLGHLTRIQCYGKNIPRKCENFNGMKKLYFMFLLNQFIHTFEVTNMCLNTSMIPVGLLFCLT